MSKKIQVTKMVLSIRIICLDPSSSKPLRWGILIGTQPSNKSSLTYENFFLYKRENLDELEQIEPGMYVTILYYAHNDLERKGIRMTKASNIFINHNETEEKRNEFDFEEDEDDDPRFVMHKFLTGKSHKEKG